MKIGVADYGMNVWYGGFYDLEKRLLDLKEIGYNGIERLDEAVSADDAMERAALFKKLGMDFATCRGQNIGVSIRWTAALGKEYVWIAANAAWAKGADQDLFIRHSRAQAAVSALYGVKTVMHNHLWSCCETQEEIERFLDNAPECGLLLDTGHLAAAGGDCLKIVEKYFSRIAAVHVKDYTLLKNDAPLSDHSRGRFCELGAGNIGLDNAAVVKLLAKKGYNGWILVEHDTHLRDPLIDLKVSRDYLKKAGF